MDNGYAWANGNFSSLFKSVKEQIFFSFLRIVLYCIYLADFVLEENTFFLMQDLDAKYKKNLI